MPWFGLEKQVGEGDADTGQLLQLLISSSSNRVRVRFGFGFGSQTGYACEKLPTTHAATVLRSAPASPAASSGRFSDHKIASKQTNIQQKPPQSGAG